MDRPLLKAVMHVHTRWSHDASMWPDRLIAACLDQGVDILAVTDHNEIDGAREVQKRAPFRVIIGEEIRTREGGEIIGLFLTEHIPARLPVKETIARIRAQNGLVYVPHPFDEARGKRFLPVLLDAIAPEIDIVETFNARNRTPGADARAVTYAEQHGKLRCVGADAHLPTEIGRTLTYLPAFETPREFLDALRSARHQEERNPSWVHAASGLCRFLSHPQSKR